MTSSLNRKFVEKPWGRDTLPAPFPTMPGKRIGEIWFEATTPLPLMLKYLFTSEKLSIQVHPSDAEAVASGLPGGKEECWLVLDADPGATLGIGLKAATDRDEIEAAATSGAIEAMMDWKPVSRGDFFYIPAGTIHAIGAGVALVEMQQNADITYRLYDYGRPRELHLEEGLAVANGGPYDMANHRRVDFGVDQMLVDGPLFRMALTGTTTPHLDGTGPYLLAPLSGSISASGLTAGPGDCIAAETLADVVTGRDSRMLIARSL